MESTPELQWLAETESFRRKSDRVRLKFALPTFLVILIAITGLVIILLNYFLSASSLRYVARNYIHEVSRHALEKTVSHLAPAERIVKLNSSLLSPDNASDNYVSTFNNVTIRELEEYPQFALVYFGDKSGNFWMNAREPSGAISLQIVRRFDDSEKSREVIDHARAMPRNTEEERAAVAALIEPYVRTIWWNRDTKGEVTNTEVDASYPYDPRLRPWYKKAKSRNKVSWTDAYMFSSSGRLYASGKPGLTVASPVYDHEGKFVGVAAVDMVLEELSNFFKQLKIEKHGRAFIINSMGRTIALRENKDLMTEEDGQVKLNHVEYISDKAISDSFSALHKNIDSCPYNALLLEDETLFSFKSGSDKYFGFYQPFPNNLNLDWYIGIVVPEKDFIGKVNRNIYISVAASLVLVLLVIWLSIYFTSQVTRPINLVAKEAQKIRKFELGEPLRLASPFHEIDWLTSSFNSMEVGLKSFRKYVPADLVSYLLESGQEAELGGRNRPMTIWFSDVADFTTISEAMPPQELVEHLGEYMGELSRIILNAHGTVDKYIGDAIMAFWNAPQNVDDHAYLACKTALACQAKLDELGAKWRERGLPELKSRIGLNSGEVVVGNMGSDERLNYTVLGDAVNLASRLEALGKLYGVRIIIGEQTYNATKDYIEARRLDRVAVKGKTQGVVIYELLGMKGEVDDETLSFTGAYEVALETYFARQFKIAGQLFHAAYKQRPSDVAAKLFVKRSLFYMKSPPPEDWDGTFVMTRK